MNNRIFSYGLPAIIGCVAAVSLISMTGKSQAEIRRNDGLVTTTAINPDLQHLFDTSQTDRVPFPGEKKLDLKTLTANDQIRVKQVHELYKKGEIKSPTDFYNAAVVLEHGQSPEDYILAHD